MIPHYVYFIFPVFLFCVYILSNFSYLSSRFGFKLCHCFIQLIHFPFKFQQLYFKFQCISYYIIILITKRCYNIKSYIGLTTFQAYFKCFICNNSLMLTTILKKVSIINLISQIGKQIHKVKCHFQECRQ